MAGGKPEVLPGRFVDKQTAGELGAPRSVMLTPRSLLLAPRSMARDGGAWPVVTDMADGPASVPGETDR